MSLKNSLKNQLMHQLKREHICRTKLLNNNITGRQASIKPKLQAFQIYVLKIPGSTQFFLNLFNKSDNMLSNSNKLAGRFDRSNFYFPYQFGISAKFEW